MKIDRIEDMKDGWFIGNFAPAAYSCEEVEVCHKIHPAGEQWATHYHKEAIEITYLIRGKMTIQNRVLISGDIFTIFPYEIADPDFIEDCEVLIIKLPSVPGDKYEVT